MGMFDNLKNKAGEMKANYDANAPEREARRAEKKAAKERKQNFIGWATGSHFPIGTKVYLSENEEENVLELEHPNGDVFVLANTDISKAYPPVLGIIDIERTGKVAVAFGATDQTTIIHGAKYLVETVEGLRIMLSIVLGEPMYKVERVIY